MTTTPAPTKPTAPLTRPWIPLLLGILLALNAVLRLADGNYHAAGYWLALSLAFGLSWLARRYQLPALKYFAAGAIATGLLLLGLEMRADHAASQARHHQPAAATK